MARRSWRDFASARSSWEIWLARSPKTCPPPPPVFVGGDFFGASFGTSFSAPTSVSLRLVGDRGEEGAHLAYVVHAVFVPPVLGRDFLEGVVVPADEDGPQIGVDPVGGPVAVIQEVRRRPHHVAD